MKRIVIFLLSCSVLAFSVIFSGCNYSNKALLQKRLQNIEKYSGNPGNIEEIKKGIEKYDAEARELAEKNAKIGIWYKILGTRYLDKKMYGKALESFQKAIEFYPENPNLYYYVGVSAAFVSHSALDFNGSGRNDAKMNYLRLSESAFKQALNIDGRYAKALYSLGVLYVYDLDDGEQAVKYLERYVEIEKRDTDGMQVLASAYYMTSQFEKAAEMYDKIISITKSAERKADAESKKKVMLDAIYGN